MNIYQQQILDHYHNPRNFGKPEQYTHSFFAENLNCGDEIEFFLEIDPSTQQVKQACFTGNGCAISLAAASLLSEELVGMKEQDLLELKQEGILELLGIPLTTSRLKCATLPLEAVKSALKTEKQAVEIATP